MKVYLPVSVWTLLLATSAAIPEPDPCRGPPVVLTGRRAGILDYPYGNIEYGNRQTCHWLLRAPDQFHVVRITVFFMDIEDDNPCSDYVQIYQAAYLSATDKDYRQKAVSPQLCVDNVSYLSQKVYIVNSPEAYIYFKSDWSRGDDGFTLLFEFVPTAEIDFSWDYNSDPYA